MWIEVTETDTHAFTMARLDSRDKGLGAWHFSKSNSPIELSSVARDHCLVDSISCHFELCANGYSRVRQRLYLR